MSVSVSVSARISKTIHTAEFHRISCRLHTDSGRGSVLHCRRYDIYALYCTSGFVDNVMHFSRITHGPMARHVFVRGDR